MARMVILSVLALAIIAVSLAEDYSGLDDEDYGNQVGKPPGQTSVMTYPEALRLAQQGKADKQVLEVFRNAYEEVRRGYNEQLINERKVNLAAILLDVANKEGDPNVWTAMYKEAEQISAEVLEASPDDESALANQKAARNSLLHRSNSAGGGGAARPPEKKQAKVPNKVKEARSFIEDEDEEEEEEDLRDQEGDDDEEEEKEKVHIKDEDQDEEEEDLPPPKKSSANAGADGSKGAAATPTAKSLCDDHSCSPLAEEWLNAWAKSPEMWTRVVQDLRAGKLTVVSAALKAEKAEAVREAAAALDVSGFSVESSTTPFAQKHLHKIEASSASFPAAITELTNLLSGQKIKDVLGQASGVLLDGPVIVKLVWRKPGDYARVNRTGEDVKVDGGAYRTRIGFRLELPLEWNDEWGGETLWTMPLFALAPKHNQMLFFPAGPSQTVQAIMSDAAKVGQGKHLVLEGWYTSSKAYDAKMIEKGYDILKSRAKGTEVYVVGSLINGVTAVAAPLKAGNY